MNDEKNKDIKEENVKSEINESEKSHPDLPKHRIDDWMIKPCYTYLDEYKDCKCIGSRFYQNFYYGEQLDCTQWKIDYKNCNKWQNHDDDTAYNELLASEKKRRLQRLTPHVNNDVWKRRSAPPSDWSDPLPEWMIERDETTFLAAKQKEITEKGYDSELDLYVPSCSIL